VKRACGPSSRYHATVRRDSGATPVTRKHRKSRGVEAGSTGVRSGRSKGDRVDRRGQRDSVEVDVPGLMLGQVEQVGLRLGDVGLARTAGDQQEHGENHHRRSTEATFAANPARRNGLDSCAELSITSSAHPRRPGVTDGLGPGRVGAGQQSGIQRLEGDALLAQLALEVLVPLRQSLVELLRRLLLADRVDLVAGGHHDGRPRSR